MTTSRPYPKLSLNVLESIGVMMLRHRAGAMHLDMSAAIEEIVELHPTIRSSSDAVRDAIIAGARLEEVDLIFATPGDKPTDECGRMDDDGAPAH